MTKKQQLIELMHRQMLAKNPHMALADAADSQLIAPILEHFMKNIDFVKPVKGQDYFTEAEKAMFYSALYNELRANIKDGAPGARGEKGDSVLGPVGPKGERGSDGKTPIRGVDYFTTSDVDMIVRRVISSLPAPKDPKLPDVGVAIQPHLEEFKKNLPTNDSLLVSILKDPRLRLLLHGGGGGGATTTYYDNEVVSGSGTTFTLAHTPTAGSVRVFARGQRLALTSDYTISGSTITTINTWSAGDIVADYRA